MSDYRHPTPASTNFNTNFNYIDNENEEEYLTKSKKIPLTTDFNIFLPPPPPYPNYNKTTTASALSSTSSTAVIPSSFTSNISILRMASYDMDVSFNGGSEQLSEMLSLPRFDSNFDLGHLCKEIFKSPEIKPISAPPLINEELELTPEEAR